MSSETGLDIAVIGMAGTFPGARDIHEFWSNLERGVESVSFYSQAQLSESGVPVDLMQQPGFVPTNGAVLEDKEMFDASFFGYTPLEALVMDPQARKFQQCAWTALEHAGYDTGNYELPIGIFAGSSDNFYWEALASMSGKKSELGDMAANQLISREFLATRTAYNLNLKGPAFTVLTACSTSLVAIHLACQALLNGECAMALAGGVSIRSYEPRGYLYQEGAILSPDGHCRAFDANASGAVAGEGCGVVALKLLQDAFDDGDYIHALVKSTAVNNDGMEKGAFPAPGIHGQAEVIRAALHVAAVPASSIGYIETHGTGTALGDPIEIEALKMAYSDPDNPEPGASSIAIGSLKTNIGHLDAAAGVAGFIKTVLALKHRKIPPSLHFQSPNPKIDFQHSPFYVNSVLSNWPDRDNEDKIDNKDQPLRAAVSSFGIGGTNAHAILEQAPPRPAVQTEARDYQILMLSAKTPSALEQMKSNLASHLERNLDRKPALALPDVAYTLQVGRRDFACRWAGVCTGLEDAIQVLREESRINDESHKDNHDFVGNEEEKRVIFMFPGQGAQYIDMGLELYQKEPFFRQELDRCFQIMDRLTGISLKTVLYPGGGGDAGASETIKRTEYAQPLLFAIEYALACLLIHWGIRPYAMTGHSIGEFTAACLAGVFSLEDALKLVTARGTLMQALPSGSMLGVPLPHEEVAQLLAGDGQDSHPQLSIAAINTPGSCVVSGPHEAIAVFARQLAETGVETRRLHTSHAFHSEMMQPILETFRQTFQGIRLNAPKIPYISNLSGAWIDARDAASPEYWAGHLRQTVRFSEGIGQLMKLDNTVFVEVGPGKTLSGFVNQHKDNAPPDNTPGNSCQKGNVRSSVNLIRHPRRKVPDQRFLMEQLSRLWLLGVEADWQAFHEGRERSRLPLPTYPFEQRRYGFKSAGAPFLMAAGGIGSRELEVHADDAPTEVRKPERTLIEPRNETETVLLDTWRVFLGVEDIDVTDDFFRLGGDSLKALNISRTLHQRYNLRIPLEAYFEYPTIRQFAGSIDNALGAETGLVIPPAEKKEYYVLSPAQRRLFILQSANPGTVSYNVTGGGIIHGDLDRDRLEEALKQLLLRHASLRTHFIELEGQVYQVVEDNPEHVGFCLETIPFAPEGLNRSGNTGGNTGDVTALVSSFIRPFDLTRPPLMRAALVELTAAASSPAWMLVTDMHHIIADGVSQGIFRRDLIALYLGRQPGPLELSYVDFCQWKSRHRDDRQLTEMKAYWLERFEGEVPVLNLPYDYRRPSVRSFEGDSFDFYLDEEHTAAIKSLALEQGVTLYMFLLSLCFIFLSKVSGQQDIVIGASPEGRIHADLEHIIGMFVNTVPLRCNPAADKTFSEFLREVKHTALKGFENQAYQFDELVEALELERDMSRTPLFDVMFMFDNIDLNNRPLEIEGFSFSPLDYKNRISKFDLNFNSLETQGRILINLEYCTRLFTAETIALFIEYFKRISGSVLDNPEILLSQISINSGQYSVQSEGHWLDDLENE